MEEVGMYLMYDMRNTYMNATSVTMEVNSIKSRKNLLIWYTADEPDGPTDPLDATSNAYDLIASLDGGGSTSIESQGVGYHPVSLVLNCQDYQWSSYTRGTDVVMQDTYMISNNVTYSTVYGTVCTEDYGCCGWVIFFYTEFMTGFNGDLDATIAKAPSRISRLGWTSSDSACLSMAGIGQRPSGLSRKALATTRKLTRPFHDKR